jgi:hypothetical protein
MTDILASKRPLRERMLIMGLSVVVLADFVTRRMQTEGYRRAGRADLHRPADHAQCDD